MAEKPCKGSFNKCMYVCMYVCKFKEEAIKIMEEGGFQLHKWHSNIPEVEASLSNSGNALASQ